MRKTITAMMLMVFSVGWSMSQRAGSDSLRRDLFAPELIMRNQGILQLSEEQRTYIVKQIQEAQAEFTSLQWRLQREMEALSGLVNDPSADEGNLISQLDRVLDLERQIKRRQLLLAVRIKNELTEEQRAQLRELRQTDQPRRTNPNRTQPRERTRPRVPGNEPTFR